ncbi:hypothetical protein HDU97_004348 [Phlyctochytrium planicorne]|nr:hypothetical protein HDU97_004348 [Phlyctochytrium planicorne]
MSRPGSPPPKGFQEDLVEDGDGESPFSYESLTDDSKEVWLIRCPLNFPTEALDGVSIPVNDNQGADKPVLKLNDVEVAGKNSTKGKGKGGISFGLFHLGGAKAGDVAQLGEMAEMKCLCPDTDSSGYKCASKSFQRFFSILPMVEVPGFDSFEKTGSEILHAPYVPRVHPPYMKLQFEPFGSTTAGSALESVKSQYTGADKNQESKSKEKKRKADDGVKKEKLAESPKKKKK